MMGILTLGPRNREVGRGRGRKGRREGKEGKREKGRGISGSVEGGGQGRRKGGEKEEERDGREGKPALLNCIASCIRGLNQPELGYLQIHQSYVNGMQISPPIPDCHCFFLVSSRVGSVYNITHACAYLAILYCFILSSIIHAGS